MKILFLAHRIPFPPDKGDKIRSYQVLQYLAARHEVHLACLIDNPRDARAAKTLRADFPPLHYERLRTARQRMRMLAALCTGKPLTASYFYVPALQRKLNALVAAERFDALFVYSSTMAEYLRDLQIPLRLIDYCDLDSQKFKQFSEASALPLSWLYRFEGKRLAVYEREAAKKFSRVFFINPQERLLFEQNGGANNTALLSNGVDFARYHGETLPDAPASTSSPYLAFTGAMDYLPNVDAAFWCAREIFPRLKASMPEMKFYIIGGNPTRKIRKLHDPSAGIFVTGYLEDLRPLLMNARVFVAPMRIARGMQTKILEAMACGVPVVTSAHAAAGLGANAEREVLIAESAGEYAQQTLRLLHNSDEHERLRRAAFAFLRQNFDWKKNLAVLDQLLPSA